MALNHEDRRTGAASLKKYQEKEDEEALSGRPRPPLQGPGGSGSGPLLSFCHICGLYCPLRDNPAARLCSPGLPSSGSSGGEKTGSATNRRRNGGRFAG